MALPPPTRLLCCTLALAGCEAAPEVAYVTDRLEIAPDFDHRVCEGTLAHLDEHVGFVEDELTRWLPPGERIRFYWLTQGVDGWCSKGAAGCYYPGTRVVIGDSSTVTHEIVHAVLDAEATTNLFLEEALAEVFSGVGAYHDAAHGGRPTPSELIWLSPSEYRKGDLDYVVASHFMNYLYRQHGRVPVRGLAARVIEGASPEALEAEIEDEFERSFPALEAEYLGDAPIHIRGLREARIATLTLGEVPLEVELDCDASSTFGPRWDGEPGMFRPHGVLVPAAGDYELELEADPELELSIIDLRRQRSRGHIVDWNNPITLEDVELPTLRGGEHARVQLREGTHLFVFSTRGYAPGSARVRATRIDTRPHFAAP